MQFSLPKMICLGAASACFAAGALMARAEPHGAREKFAQSPTGRSHATARGETKYLEGRAQLAAQQYDAAIQAFDLVIEAGPHSLAFYYRALANLGLNRLDAAKADYTAQLSIRPTDAYAFWGRAQVHNRQNRYHEARADAERALAIDHRLSGARYHGAYAQFRLGAYRTAQQQVIEGLAIDPTSDCLLELARQLKRVLEDDCEPLLISDRRAPLTVAVLRAALSKDVPTRL